MREVVIARHGSTPWGTFGHLAVAGERFPTVELPWKGNQRNISCVPTGTYELVLGRHVSEDGSSYPCYELRDVPGRSNVEIHIGNHIRHLLGCVAIGTRFEIIDGLPGVASSSVAHARWMAIMADAPRARLTILDRVPYDWSEEG